MERIILHGTMTCTYTIATMQMRNTGSIEIPSLNVALSTSTTIAASMLYIADLYFVVIFLVLLAADEIGLVVHRSHFSEYGKAKD